MNETIEQMFSLKGKVAVVLGGTSGIGQAIARGYAQAGAAVIASSRDVDKVDAMGREFELAGVPTLRVTSDVQNRASLEDLCAATVKAFGKVDVLMVTSGVLKKGPTADMTDEDWERVVDINLNGSFRANQVFGRQMIAQKAGSIINTCSLTTFVSFNEVTAYAASKAAVGMLTKELACEWAQHGIRVNAIAPGVFRTPLNSHVIDLPERKAAILPRTPMGRYGSVEELVGLAIYLASDASSFTTGQVIAVDGGFLAKGV
ncbi:MAG: SDR family oxidoreductase [Bryobacteraceae bacterium]|nr:SDR family oxidoreductase [Bryobacteraceae bacterium]